jgi:hypothetical protein
MVFMSFRSFVDDTSSSESIVWDSPALRGNGCADCHVESEYAQAEFSIDRLWRHTENCILFGSLAYPCKDENRIRDSESQGFFNGTNRSTLAL